MALRSFSNANTARVQAFVADGGLAAVPTINTANRVVVIGMFNNSAIPVQTLYPATPGSVAIADLIPMTYNKVVVNNVPVYYPSEVSIQLSELQAAGVATCQVIRSADDDRYRDVTARMARQRFIANENAYELLADVPVDYIVPCNVVAGLKGDGMYNNNSLGEVDAPGDTSVEVIYDPDLYAAELVAKNKLIADLPGFVAGTAADYTKGSGVPVNEPEDLVYQLADACRVISTNGTYCVGVARTLNAVELKSITLISVGSTAGKGTNWGADATGVANLVPNAPIWAMTKVSATKTLLDDYVFTTGNLVGGVMTNQEVLTAVEDIARMASVAGVKSVLRDTSAEPVVADGATYAEVLTYRLAYGTPSRSEVRTWEKYLNDFGNTYGSGVASMIELNGVTDADGDGIADYYKLWATSTHEKPSNELDSAVLKDFNGAPVDLGVYIDVIAANSILPLGANTNLISTTKPKKFTFGSGAGQIVGWYCASSDSTTRKTTGNLSPLGFLGGRAVSEFTRNRFLTFFIEDAEYKLARGITMGKFVSDSLRTNFINRFTTRVVKDASDLACAEGRKYLGKPDSAEVRASIKQKLEQEFTRWARPEDARLKRPAVVDVLSVGTDAVIGKLLIQLRLAVAGEILDITTQTSLER